MMYRKQANPPYQEESPDKIIQPPSNRQRNHCIGQKKQSTIIPVLKYKQFIFRKISYQPRDDWIRFFKQPENMSMPESFLYRIRIFFSINMFMMKTVVVGPSEYTSLACHCPKENQRYFYKFICFVSPVRIQAVISCSNTDPCQ